MKDIQAENIQEYLEGAKARGCTQNTIDTYANNLFKIQGVINTIYSIKINWMDKISVPVAKRLKVAIEEQIAL